MSKSSVPPDVLAEAKRKAKLAGADPRIVDAPVQDPDAEKKSVPPVIRSILEFGAQTSMVLAKAMRAAPGIQGGLFYKGKPYCYSAGFRDLSRGMDTDDKGNFLRIRDPMGYGSLTIPVVTGSIVWKLHKEGKFDIDTPLPEFIPELPVAYEVLTARDILAFTCGLRDDAVFRSLGISLPSRFCWNASTQWQSNVYRKLEEQFLVPEFREGSVTAPSPSVQDAERQQIRATTMRAALVKHVASHKAEIGSLRRLQITHARPSHCALALLAAAIERKCKAPFEQLVQKQLFEGLDVPTLGLGVPAIIHRSSVFYQLTGMPSGHLTLNNVAPPGDVRNAAPPLFNSSLNLFGSPEDFSKLLVSTFDKVKLAVKELRPPIGIAPYHELGVRVNRRTKRAGMMQEVRGDSAATPFVAAANYSFEHDCGAFAVVHCGTRRARALVNVASPTVSQLFTKQVLDTGMPIDGKEEDGPDQKSKIAELTDKYFKKAVPWSGKFKKFYVSFCRNLCNHQKSPVFLVGYALPSLCAFRRAQPRRCSCGAFRPNFPRG